MKEKEFKISYNAVVNLVHTYAVNKISAEDYFNNSIAFCDEDDLYDDPDYAHHMAYCYASEEWMRAIGISPESNFVQNIIDKERG